MEYTTKEMLQKLCENSNREFECKGDPFSSIITKAYVDIDGSIICKWKHSNLPALISISDKWTLIQKPVSFMAAANSGKRIKLFEPEKYEFLNCISSLNDFNYTSMQLRSISSYQEQYVSQAECRKRVVQLLNAKWLIED